MSIRTLFLVLVAFTVTLRGAEKTSPDVFQIRLASESPAAGLSEMKLVTTAKDALSPPPEILYIEEEPLLNASALRWVSIKHDRLTQAPLLEIAFTPEGAKRFAGFTEANVGRRLAILLNGELRYAPRVASSITGGIAQIGGISSFAEAAALVRRIRYSLSEGPQPAKSELSFKQREFTFVRVQYSAGRHSSWQTDYPDADVNFALRFHEVTGLKIVPEGKILKLTDPELNHYPFIYMAEGGDLRLSAEEAKALRQYLSDGGFLMVDDFWGEDEWQSLISEVRKAIPDANPVELPLDHPLFHCYYDVNEKPQIPNVGQGIASRFTGVTWERDDAKQAHYRGLFDTEGRLLAVFCHNTDFGDGWEREAEDEYYFKEFSLKRAYPMGINIVVYALTH